MRETRPCWSNVKVARRGRQQHCHRLCRGQGWGGVGWEAEGRACGVAEPACLPASLPARWLAAHNLAPFAALVWWQEGCSRQCIKNTTHTQYVQYRQYTEVQADSPCSFPTTASHRKKEEGRRACGKHTASAGKSRARDSKGGAREQWQHWQSMQHTAHSTVSNTTALRPRHDSPLEALTCQPAHSQGLVDLLSTA